LTTNDLPNLCCLYLS